MGEAARFFFEICVNMVAIKFDLCYNPSSEKKRWIILLKSLYTPTDMTQGAPWKSILMFTLPMLIGNIAQQLYNTVDSIVVGKYIGDSALAAVGSAGPIINMLLVLFIGISAGASIMVSQYFGAKNREKLSYTIGNCITVTIICCVGLIAIATPLIRPVLVMLNTPDTIIDGCTNYLVISLVGIAGLAFYNILSGIIRGLGDSFTTLIYLLVATVINIILRYKKIGAVSLTETSSEIFNVFICLPEPNKLMKYPWKCLLCYLKFQLQFLPVNATILQKMRE